MRPVRLAEDIVPISDFKAQAAEWLKRVAKTGHPLVITQNGKAAGVLLSPAQFDALSERSRLREAIEEGLADSEAGRVHSHAGVVAELKKRRQARKSK
jgi:prevent-host-death family protein